MINIEFLKKIELFNSLNDEQLTKIAELIKISEYNDGDIIFEEASMPDNLYLILQGKTKIIKKIVDSEIKIFWRIINFR